MKFELTPGGGLAAGNGTCVLILLPFRRILDKNETHTHNIPFTSLKESREGIFGQQCEPENGFLPQTYHLAGDTPKIGGQLLIMIHRNMRRPEQSAFSAVAHPIAEDPGHYNRSSNARQHRPVGGEGPSSVVGCRYLCIRVERLVEQWSGVEGAAPRHVACCMHDIKSSSCPNVLGDVSFAGVHSAINKPAHARNIAAGCGSFIRVD